MGWAEAEHRRHVPPLGWIREVHAVLFNFDGFTIIRMTFIPGMRYSRDIRPHVPASHEQAPPRPVYCQSGRLHFVQPD